MNYAWMIRQDGKEFECNHHFYCMNDDDLSSEAECSAFIITPTALGERLPIASVIGSPYFSTEPSFIAPSSSMLANCSLVNFSLNAALKSANL